MFKNSFRRDVPGIRRHPGQLDLKLNDANAEVGFFFAATSSFPYFEIPGGTLTSKRFLLIERYDVYFNIKYFSVDVRLKSGIG